jgi:type 1 glutamine amidotransferase
MIRRAALLALAWATAAVAQSSIDCPLENVSYSIDSPLIDVLLKPEAKAVVDQAEPTLFDKLPRMFIGTTAPSFSAIITTRIAASFKGIPDSRLSSIDEALRALPITDADRKARCGRFDVDRPHLVIPKGRPRLLFFEKINGFRDGPSVEAARHAFETMAARNGWALVTTDKGGAITPSILKEFDAVIWNNVSGDVLTMKQREALKTYIEHGGGFVAFHGSGGDPVYFWDWYADTLIGARFKGHPLAPQFQDAHVVVEDTGPVGKALAPGWIMSDECYSFNSSPRAAGAHVIATLDESSYSPKGMGNQDLRMGDHPIAWQKCVGQGRAFYSAIGHRPETYTDSHYVTLLENAVRWAASPERPCHQLPGV